MNRGFKCFWFSILILLQSNVLMGQNLEGVRYKITSDLLLDLGDRFPEKSDEIEKKIGFDLPQYVDFILLDKELINLFWKYDSTLLAIHIFSRMSGELIVIDNCNSFSASHLGVETDTMNIIRKQDVSDTTYKYSVFEADAAPLTIVLNDSLKMDALEITHKWNNYPEAAIVMTFNVFPEKIEFGKSVVTYDFHANFMADDLFDLREYENFVKKKHSKRKRKKFIALLNKAYQH